MAKETLLEIVQDIMNDLDMDEVNSIDDTVESLQVANIVKSTFKALMSSRNWPHTNELIRITPSGDDNLPNIMTLEDDIKEMISVYYNKQKQGETRLRYEPVKYIEPDDMLRIFYARNNTEDDIDVINHGNQVYIIKNDLAPTYYTSFDDNTLVFDSYDSAVDTTLQSSKTQVRAYVIPNFTLSDDFVPDLPEEAFSLLIEESKAKSAMKIGQKQDAKSEQESRRQNQWMSRKAWRVKGGVKYQRFGRKPRRARDVTFRQDRE